MQQRKSFKGAHLVHYRKGWQSARGVFSLSRVASALLILALFFGFTIQEASAQTYNARTDVAPQIYPNPVPCPYNGTGCTPGHGSLTGQGYCFTPTDFSTQICRVTDYNSGGPQPDYGATCSGDAETMTMDESDTRIAVCSAGGQDQIESFNPSTLAISTLYRTQGPGSDGALGGCSSTSTYLYRNTIFFSYTQPQVGYGASFLSNGDPAICEYSFSSATTMPTYDNGGVTPLIDLATCVSSIAGVGYGTYTLDVTVSADDQTFVALGNTGGGGQDTSASIYVIVWNRTNGCRVWNTAAGTVTGAWGATGSISLTDRFYIHEFRINKAGTAIKVTANTCAPSPGGCTGNTNIYIWQLSGLTLTRMVNDATDGCGHSAIGYAVTFNNCSGFFVRPFSSNDQAGTNPTTQYPSPNSAQDGHYSMYAGNAADTSPVMGSFYTGSFAGTNAWDNEILGIRLDGSGTVYRFCHNYITGQDTQNFGAEYGIGNVSQDGKYFLWTSDWDGMLGEIGGGSSSCTIGTNCRADVFLAILPVTSTTSQPAPSVPAPPTSLRAIVE